MQFINIVVHSVEDMNFRVHLQYEFTKLGLEEFLQVRGGSRVRGAVPGGSPILDAAFVPTEVEAHRE